MWGRPEESAPAGASRPQHKLPPAGSATSEAFTAQPAAYRVTLMLHKPAMLAAADRNGRNAQVNFTEASL